ncbi:alkaline phosphatase family protein [Gulosibacter bifidus]|uniref:Alkaline phosphatase family protein n=1 Tax=Gulosibacter bifidus TaxID=272239 RepID=A0ABW5RFD5_9MICO|nr:alkaline phosphatase family protein [Gulosibacter bifidus]
MLLNRSADRPLLADVLPNCVAAMRGNVPESGDFGLPAVRGCIVVMVDGLGAHLLRTRAGHARTLSRAWQSGDELVSFPSTTVAGITSLTTGTLAGAHGLVSYSVWDRDFECIRNQISGWDASGMHPATWQLAPTVFERESIDSAVVSVAAYRESGLTNASLRGAEYVCGESMLERSRLAAQYAREHDRPLVYCYHAELDQAGHQYGWASSAWTARLEELDAAIAELVARAPADIGILVVADHGMIDTLATTQVDIPDEALTGIVSVAGEPRLRHLYLDDALTPDDEAAVNARIAAADRIRAALDGRALVVTRDDAIAWGWYGADPHWAAVERIGDVLVAATADEAYYTADMPESMRQMVGQHGSVTEAEITVPCIRLGAFATE